MGLKIDIRDIDEHDTEYGVQFDDGFVYLASDEEDARATHQMTGGNVVTRQVYSTVWAELA